MTQRITKVISCIVFQYLFGPVYGEAAWDSFNITVKCYHHDHIYLLAVTF